MARHLSAPEQQTYQPAASWLIVTGFGVPGSGPDQRRTRRPIVDSTRKPLSRVAPLPNGLEGNRGTRGRAWARGSPGVLPVLTRRKTAGKTARSRRVRTACRTGDGPSRSCAGGPACGGAVGHAGWPRCGCRRLAARRRGALAAAPYDALRSGRRTAPRGAGPSSPGSSPAAFWPMSVRGVGCTLCTVFPLIARVVS